MEDSGDEQEPRFIVDSMLGSLARWLRMLGYDTVYARDWHDSRILEIAAREGRILVTRDRSLYTRARRRGLRTVYVVPDVVKSLAILAQKTSLRLSIDPSKSRCPLCNAPLREADKDEVRGRVPQRVLELYDKFWVCTGCGQVYWMGGHWKTIRQMLEKAMSIAQQRPRRVTGASVKT